MRAAGLVLLLATAGSVRSRDPVAELGSDRRHFINYIDRIKAGTIYAQKPIRWPFARSYGPEQTTIWSEVAVVLLPRL